MGITRCLYSAFLFFPQNSRNFWKYWVLIHPKERHHHLLSKNVMEMPTTYQDWVSIFSIKEFFCWDCWSITGSVWVQVILEQLWLQTDDSRWDMIMESGHKLCLFAQTNPIPKGQHTQPSSPNHLLHILFIPVCWEGQEEEYPMNSSPIADMIPSNIPRCDTWHLHFHHLLPSCLAFKIHCSFLYDPVVSNLIQATSFY